MAPLEPSNRSLSYIRLAAFLAGQPASIDRLEMTVPEVEGVVGKSLPTHARFPWWWRNDINRVHARAWMTAGWRIEEMIPAEGKVVVVRDDGNGYS